MSDQQLSLSKYLDSWKQPIAEKITAERPKDEVVGVLEIGELADLPAAPSKKYPWVLMTVESVHFPKQPLDKVGPFKLEHQYAQLGELYRCDAKMARVTMRSGKAPYSNGIQVIPICIRVYFAPKELREKSLRDEVQDLEVIGSTEAIAVTWMSERKIYHLKSSAGNIVGNIYMAHHLCHESDIKRSQAKKMKDLEQDSKISWGDRKLRIEIPIFTSATLQQMDIQKLTKYARDIYGYVTQQPIKDWCTVESIKKSVASKPPEKPPDDREKLLTWIEKAQKDYLRPLLPPKATHIIKVFLIGATQLRAINSSIGGGMSDPYAVAEIPLRPNSYFETTYVRNSCDPTWNQDYETECALGKEPIVFKVFDKALDMVQRLQQQMSGSVDELLGEAELSGKDFKNGFNSQVPLKMPPNGSNAGRIQLRIQIVSKLPGADDEALGRSVSKDSVARIPSRGSVDMEAHQPENPTLASVMTKPPRSSILSDAGQAPPRHSAHSFSGQHLVHSSSASVRSAGSGRTGEVPPSPYEDPRESREVYSCSSSIVLKVNIGGMRNLSAVPQGSHTSNNGACSCACEIEGKPGFGFVTRLGMQGPPHEVRNFCDGDALVFSVTGYNGASFGKATLTHRQCYPHGYDAEMTLACQSRGITGLLRVKVVVLQLPGHSLGQPPALTYASRALAPHQYPHNRADPFLQTALPQALGQNAPYANDRLPTKKERIGMSEIETVSRDAPDTSLRKLPSMRMESSATELPQGMGRGMSFHSAATGMSFHQASSPMSLPSRGGFPTDSRIGHQSSFAINRWNSHISTDAPPPYEQTPTNMNYGVASHTGAEVDRHGHVFEEDRINLSHSGGNSPRDLARNMTQPDLASMPPQTTIDLMAQRSAPPPQYPSEDGGEKGFTSFLSQTKGFVMEKISSFASGGGGSHRHEDPQHSRTPSEGIGVPPADPMPITVQVISATGLRKADFMGLSDPYVKIEILPHQPGRQSTEAGKTKVIEQNLDPVWNETFNLTDYEWGDSLKFSVFDWDRWPKEHDFLGFVTLRTEVFADQMFDPSGYVGEHTLEQAGDTQGMAKLNIKICHS